MHLENPPYQLHLQRAEALGDLGRPDAALEEAQKAVGLDPSAADAWFGLARALLALERAQEAREAAESGLQRDAGSAWGHLLRSAALSELGETEAAFEAVQRAMGLAPGHPAVHRRRAWVFLERDRPEDALLDAHLATRRYPEDPDNHLLVAQIGLLYGERGAALEAAQEAARLSPDEARVLLTLGDALAATEQPREAMAAYVRAVRADPRLPLPKARLVELVELGPLAVAQGVTGVVRLFGLLALLMGLRLMVGQGEPQDLLCVLGVVPGLVLPSLLVRQAGRLKLEEEVPGAWAVYRGAKADLQRRLSWSRRILGWLDPRR